MILLEMHAIGYGHSDVGRTREKNEDSMLVDDDAGLFIVSDGMGGHASGEVASSKAIEAVMKAVNGRRADIAEAEDADELSEMLTAVAREALETACREVHATASADEDLGGMGCTLTMLLIAGNKAVMGHVGDTRLYLNRDGKVSQLSTDHTMAQELALAGLIEPDEVKTHHYAHVLTRAIGPQPSVSVDTLVIDVLPGDRFVLCSDGLSEYIDGDAWLARQLDGSQLEVVPEELVSFANTAGGEDNITAVVVRIEADEPDSEIVDEMSIELTGKLDALQGVFLFEGLSLALLTRVLNQCDMIDYSAGDVVVTEGEDCARLMVVVEGGFSVKRVSEDDARLDVGDHAGATTLLSPRPARATLTALEPSRMLILERGPFWKLIKGRPWLGVGLLERLGRRLSRDLDRSIEQRDDGDPSTTPVEPHERF